MPWLVNPWWRRKGSPKMGKPAPSISRWSYLWVERLEKRDLFSINV